MAFRKKACFILSYKPDILIVPECEHPDKLLFPMNTPKPTDVLWFGKNQNKGLGIFSYNNFRFRVLDNHNQNLQMIIPIEFGQTTQQTKMDNILNKFGKQSIIITTSLKTQKQFLLVTSTAIQFGTKNIEKAITLML